MKRGHADDDDAMSSLAPAPKVMRTEERVSPAAAALPKTRPVKGVLISAGYSVECKEITLNAELDEDAVDEPGYEYYFDSTLDVLLGPNFESYDDGPEGWDEEDYWVFMPDQRKAPFHRTKRHHHMKNFVAMAVVERLGGDSWGAAEEWEGDVVITGAKCTSLTDEQIQAIHNMCTDVASKAVRASLSGRRFTD